MTRKENVLRAWAEVFPRLPVPPQDTIAGWVREFPTEFVIAAIRLADLRFDRADQAQIVRYIGQRLRQEAKAK